MKHKIKKALAELCEEFKGDSSIYAKGYRDGLREAGVAIQRVLDEAKRESNRNPRTFKIEGDHDDQGGGGCFWIVNEAGESQSLNFSSRSKAQAHLDWLIREAERIANQLPWPPGSGV